MTSFREDGNKVATWICASRNFHVFFPSRELDECSSIANEMATTAFFHYNYREQLLKFRHLLELKINVN